MIQIKPSPPVQGACRIGFVIGIGDGSATRWISEHKPEIQRLVTVVLPGEVISEIPGLVYLADRVTAVPDLVSLSFQSHAEMTTIGQTQFFDMHPISIDEKIREKFCRQFYRLLGDKPLEFGDDILDGMQGAYHVALNAGKLLLAATPYDLRGMSVPAISIAAGPSLSRHLPTLRALQNKCLLIACDSLLDGLLAEGIHPHLVTPVERIPEIAKAFPRDSYDTICCGKPVVHPDVMNKFARHLFAPCTDILYTWCGGHQPELTFYGQSTGTMSVAIAAQLTTGPIYLAGHDLSMEGSKSHWKDAKAVEVRNHEATIEMEGYSGTVYADWWWDMFRRQIEGCAFNHGNVINLNELDGVGAKIAHTKPGSLPRPEELPDFAFPELPAPNYARRDAFFAIGRQLPSDTRRMLRKLDQSGLSKADLDVRNLCPSANWNMWAYVLRSVYGQFSYESQSKKSDKVVMGGLIEALRSVIPQLLPMVDEMGAACV